MRPRDREPGRPAPSTTDGGLARTASSTTIGSAVRRRAAKSRAPAPTGVEQVGVVDEHRERPVLGDAASRLSIAAPTANRSPPGPGRSASAEPSASACGGGEAVERASSAGRSSSSRPRTAPRARTRRRARGARASASRRPRHRRAARSCRSRPRRMSASVPLSPTAPPPAPADGLPFALAADQHGASLGSHQGAPAPKTRGRTGASQGGPDISDGRAEETTTDQRLRPADASTPTSSCRSCSAPSTRSAPR